MSIDELTNEVAEKEKEYLLAKSKLDIAKKEESRKDKAKKFFDKNFGLNFISDNYNIYPEENYFNAESNFIKDFTDDNSYNEHLLHEQREKYVTMLKADVDTLNDRIKEIEEQYKEICEDNKNE